jgi:hypothetical protein
MGVLSISLGYGTRRSVGAGFIDKRVCTMRNLAEIQTTAIRDQWSADQLIAHLDTRLAYPATYASVTPALWRFFYLSTMKDQNDRLDITVQLMPFMPQGITGYEFRQNQRRNAAGMLLAQYLDEKRTLFQAVLLNETAPGLEGLRVIPLVMLHTFLPFYERLQNEYSEMQTHPRAEQSPGEQEVNTDIIQNIGSTFPKPRGRDPDPHNIWARAQAAEGKAIDDILPDYMKRIKEKNQTKARNRLREALRRTK